MYCFHSDICREADEAMDEIIGKQYLGESKKAEWAHVNLSLLITHNYCNDSIERRLIDTQYQWCLKGQKPRLYLQRVEVA